MRLVCARSLLQALQVWTRPNTHAFLPYPRHCMINIICARIVVYNFTVQRYFSRLFLVCLGQYMAYLQHYYRVASNSGHPHIRN